ncbi:MAG: DbpA RNA binding domain-containing protein, partial [Candidatus Eremiobacteraeota bacterium]|nr:DbpA RNA binding domain-containing protein [Candidatus Eremiobacteraeota bacterium]
RKITTENVPTVHDLRARRLEFTKTALEEVLEAGDFDAYRTVVEALSNEHDVIDIAAAAVKLADQARDGGADEEEIPKIAPPVERIFTPRPGGSSPAGGTSTGAASNGPKLRRKIEDVTKIYIGIGRNFGIRPADLVGAIAGEAKIDSREIGHIDIADKFSLVEVPGSAVEAILAALRKTTIRGKKVAVRRDREK